MSLINLIFIRHGEASDAWDNHPDPGLSKAGINQANELLQRKELNNLENYSFVSSPKLRAVETAKPLAKMEKNNTKPANKPRNPYLIENSLKTNSLFIFHLLSSLKVL